MVASLAARLLLTLAVAVAFVVVVSASTSLSSIHPLPDEVSSGWRSEVHNVVFNSTVFGGLASAEKKEVSTLITMKGEADYVFGDDSEIVEPTSPTGTIDCPTFAPRTPPSAVTDLRPQDVEIIMAMGDSITAGFAAGYKNIFSGLQEYRGQSWSIGGDDGYTTLANLIKHFNPDLTGYSVGRNPPCRRSNAHLNAAISGAIVQDMPGQAKFLIDAIKSVPGYESKWKMLTLLIGGNNLCKACDGTAKEGPTEFEVNLNETIRILRSGMSNIFINLVPMLNISTLYQVSRKSLYCNLLHKFECPCDVKSDAARKRIDEINIGDYESILKVAADYRASAGADFAVVVQPAALNTLLWDRSAVTKIDCFHPTTTTHGLMALGVWKNLFQPSTAKDSHFAPGESLYCPTETDVFRVD